MSLEALGFELEIKSKFNGKIKSHKILRLEFISDKIEGEDCKREVMCIQFGHSTNKNELVWGSMGGSHGQTWAHGRHPSGSRPRGERGGRRREKEGALLGGAMGTARLLGARCGPAAACVRALYSFLLLLLAWGRKEQAGRRREEREKKRRRGGGKRKEKRNIFQIWKFLERKIKDNLWSWSKLFL
jgi:hypothetical protein